MRACAVKRLFLLIILYQVGCVRISPKLDFGSENGASDNSRLRSAFQSGSFGYGDRNYKKVQGVDTICSSGNCNITEKQNGLSTDVVVHIQTHTDTDAKNNSTVAIPDIPVVLGTRGSENPQQIAPTSYNNFPPPFPTTTFIQDRVPQTDFGTNKGFDYNYAPGYQDNINGAERYPAYNRQNTNGNVLPSTQFTWNSPKHRDANANYNPLEFKKVYRNSLPNLPTRWMENGVPITGPNMPQTWGPCLCPNPQEQYYPANRPL